MPTPTRLQELAQLVANKLRGNKASSLTATRLEQIIALLNADGEANLAKVVQTIYPKADLTAKASRDRALNDLRKFRRTIDNIASKLGIRFSLAVDGDNRKPPHQRLLRVEYSDSNPAVTRQIEERSAAEARIDNPVIPPQGQDILDLRPIVHYYAIYSTSDPAELRLQKDLLRRLQAQLEPHTRFRFRLTVDFPIPVTGQWRRGLDQEIAHCQFGLLLLTVKLLGTGFVRTEQRFCTTALFPQSPSRQPCIPIAAGTVSTHEDLLGGIPPATVFFGPNGLSWSSCTTRQEKDLFITRLAERITEAVEAADSVTKHIEHLSEEEASRDFPKHWEPTRGARTRIENSPTPTPEPADANREPALDYLLTWIQDPKSPPYCALLGEYGMGKTTTCKALTRELTQRRARNEKGAERLPLPIYFDLRPLGKRALDLNLEEILALLLHDEWKSGPGSLTLTPQDIIAEVVRGALIIWDGLDEVLVALDVPAGQRFTRQLYSILPPQEPGKPPNPARLLISCRTHYFRTLPEQNSHFLAQERDNVRADSYRAFLLLPFTKDQIRNYIRATLPNEDTHRVIETFDSIHNLSELAERPYTLHLITQQFEEIEKAKAQGRPVTGLTLYRFMVQEWLLRDTGKHHFKPDHKQLLMEHFAARLWQRGQRTWSIGQIEDWLGEFLVAHPIISAAYTDKVRTLLVLLCYKT